MAVMSRLSVVAVRRFPKVGKTAVSVVAYRHLKAGKAVRLRAVAAVVVVRRFPKAAFLLTAAVAAPAEAATCGVKKAIRSPLKSTTQGKERRSQKEWLQAFSLFSFLYHIPAFSNAQCLASP